MTPPLVSILVRSMDRATLTRALDSVAAQTYPNIEVVVVAASGDRHRELPQACGAFPLRLVRLPRPLARAEAANVALEAARGDWLNFLDDDDELLPDHVAVLRSVLDAEPQYRLAHSLSEDVAADGSFVRYYGGRFRPWRQLDTGFFRPHCAMFASSLYDDGARFDPRFEILEDMDFFVQCAQLTPFALVEQATARYYVDAGDSGAGLGANRDEERISAAIGVLRAKWSDLEAEMRASAEFRGEQALWMLEQGMPDAAAPIIAGLMEERPESPDARTLRALLRIMRGDVGTAERLVASIGDATPSLDTVAVRLDQLRSRMGVRH